MSLSPSVAAATLRCLADGEWHDDCAAVLAEALGGDAERLWVDGTVDATWSLLAERGVVSRAADGSLRLEPRGRDLLATGDGLEDRIAELLGQLGSRREAEPTHAAAEQSQRCIFTRERRKGIREYVVLSPAPGGIVNGEYVAVRVGEEGGAGAPVASLSFSGRISRRDVSPRFRDAVEAAPDRVNGDRQPQAAEHPTPPNVAGSSEAGTQAPEPTPQAPSDEARAVEEARSEVQRASAALDAAAEARVGIQARLDAARAEHEHYDRELRRIRDAHADTAAHVSALERELQAAMRVESESRREAEAAAREHAVAQARLQERHAADAMARVRQQRRAYLHALAEAEAVSARAAEAARALEEAGRLAAPTDAAAPGSTPPEQPDVRLATDDPVEDERLAREVWAVEAELLLTANAHAGADPDDEIVEAEARMAAAQKRIDELEPMHARRSELEADLERKAEEVARSALLVEAQKSHWWSKLGSPPAAAQAAHEAAKQRYAEARDAYNSQWTEHREYERRLEEARAELRSASELRDALTSRRRMTEGHREA